VQPKTTAAAAVGSGTSKKQQLEGEIIGAGGGEMTRTQVKEVLLGRLKEFRDLIHIY
jgi:hypothetical protein